MKTNAENGSDVFKDTSLLFSAFVYSHPVTANVKPNRYHVSMLKTNKNQA